MSRNRKYFLILIVAVLFVAGCGVSQNKYDRVVQEMSEFEKKAQGMANQVDALKKDYQQMVKELQVTKQENDKLKRENNSLKAENQKLSGVLKREADRKKAS